MKHAVPYLVAVLVFVLAGCSRTAPAPPKAAVGAPYLLAEDLAEETVALVARDEDGDVYPFCTGVWVSRFEFLTAAHCATSFARKKLGLDEDAPVGTDGLQIVYFGPAEYRGVYKEPSTVYAATLRKIDCEHDLAIFSSSVVPRHLNATLAPATPHTGVPVLMVGHPVAMYWTQTTGFVAGHFDRLLQKIGPYVQIDGAIFQGCSGGGAFDYEGRLVGIAAFTAPMPGIGFFVDVETVRSFVR